MKTKPKFSISFIFKFSNFQILSLFLFSCAQIVSPTGGPKDIAPPKITKSIPQNFSTNFNGKSITLSFNEYVITKNINEELIISPPLEKTPELKIKGKSVIIDFEEKLKPNTTYTFNFGTCIADINENNPLDSNLFVFSTGNILDSLSLSGKIANAFNLKKDKEFLKNVFVMLYENSSDSAPYKELPSYIAKPKADGTYQIKNIKKGNYRGFVLKDTDADLKFSQPSEQVAFSSTVLKIENKNTMDFLLFEEDANKQYLKKYFAQQYGKITFIFNKPTEKISVKPLNHSFQKSYFFEEANLNRDTISYWFTGADSITNHAFGMR